MTRRELREHIFRLVFRTEFHSVEEMPEQKDLYMESLETVSESDRTYIYEKAGAIEEKKEEIDTLINSVTDHWSTDRMTKVDLAVIRLGAYEILFDQEVPTGVAINEAVELAKRYGTDQSPAFVNAILAKIA